ncbi:MAG: hypothetical protein ACE5GW_11990, partial [Planctomycetota bacterium]
MDPRLRLILDPPRDAAENMARDEALLDGDGAVIRRTAWRRPAATLGRFQRHSELPSEGVLLPAIRRITGGGTILHGADCTLAIAAPAPSRLFP